MVEDMDKIHVKKIIITLQPRLNSFGAVFYNRVTMNKMKLIFWMAVLIVGLISCGNNNQTDTNNPLPVPADIPKNLKLERFDQLEKIFQNENWLMLNGKDSSYLYCSRLGQRNFKTYQYKMSKGDSVSSVITEIRLSSDTITWQLPVNLTPVYLNKISANEIVWADNKNLDFYVFQKIDSDHIQLKFPNGELRNLLKTITLSSFLVRSKYDYLHGTKIAFDKTKK
jgi:hypothetical protein